MILDFSNKLDFLSSEHMLRYCAFPSRHVRMIYVFFKAFAGSVLFRLKVLTAPSSVYLSAT